MEQEEEKSLLSFFEKKEFANEQKNLINKALDFLQKKKSKNVKEIIRISEYLHKKKFKKNLIISGLLFLDTQKGDFPFLKKEFGEEIFSILENKKKLEEILIISKLEKDKLPEEAIISSIENVEAIILHLVSKLVELENKKDKDEAKSVMEGEVFLAEKLGLKNLKKDLADEAFKTLNPKKYLEISNFLKMSRRERERYIKRIILEIEKKIKPKIKNVKIKGREKQIYSIYEKITKRKIPLNKQRDQFGVRIITHSEGDCYLIFEILNGAYPLVDGTVKDYIKNPKENGYQSLHFCIKYGTKTVEIQIRTKEMDYIADGGGAAHWAYKKIKSNEKFEKKTAWLKEVLKLKEKKSSFFGEIKLNLFKDKIYCYTPKGKSISLATGSSTLDFAYRIHAEVGNHSIGAKVNGKFVPLKTELKNGDTIEIITNKFQRPRRDWLKFVKTKYAKKIISKEVQKFENIPVPKDSFLKKELNEREESPAEIKDFPKHLLNFARCCNPLPDEEIIGIVKSYRKALIHKKDCNRISGKRINEVKAEWKEVFSNPIKIFVQTSDRSGILADIINTLLRKNFKVKETNAKLSGNNFAECYFTVLVNTKEELKEAIKRIKKIKGVMKVWFD
ncbi:MAG: TGS domain-containing protein [Nanoarchaeota archaeon]|nr:TGS domain-containing protein [Nanoarchaeota archaeon]